MCSTKQRLAAVLREQRTSRGWTLREAADKACLSPSTLSRWESGTHLPRVPELESLLTSLGVSRRDVIRILSSLNAPRATRALREHVSDPIAEPLAPSGGDFLRLLRRRAGLTISQVADHLNVAASTVSRWESSVAHPSPQAAGDLMDLLNASSAERRCYDVTGVAKIKSRRAPFDAVHYQGELEKLEARIVSGRWEDCELRLMQLQSNLWWQLAEPGARELLRRAQVLHGEFLVCARRFSEAEPYAEAALEGVDEFSDLWCVRAQIILARTQAFRGLEPRPHLGLLTLQRCLQQVQTEDARAHVLMALAELSVSGGRHFEARSYALRAQSSAERVGDANVANRAADFLRVTGGNPLPDWHPCCTSAQEVVAVPALP